MNARELLTVDAPIDGKTYGLIGLCLFAVKHVIDRLVSALVFDRPWSLWSYLIPTETFGLLHLPERDMIYYGVMLLVALPFIWIGVALTIRRLRTLDAPIYLVLLFFLPIVNLLLFALLSIAREREASDGEEAPRRVEPIETQRELSSLDSSLVPYAAAVGTRLDGRVRASTPARRAALKAGAVLMPQPVALLMTVLSVTLLEDYGWGVFVGLPFALSVTSVILNGTRGRRGAGECIAVGCLSVIVWGGLLLVMAFEGFICLLMASPLAIGVAILGSVVGYWLQPRSPGSGAPIRLMSVLLLLLPALMGAEHLGRPDAPVFAARTSVIVDAPPDVVWRHVVGFPRLAAPTEWIFRAGVAYPTGATIDGRGVGAVRRCEFSTGAFVEPIEVWDPPHLLRFSVASNPPPMRELSPYGDIDAPHLHDFLVARRGQFQLTALPDGRTRLEGTTWYQHNMWPASYWRLWSDYLVHNIHLRVLRHVRTLSEPSAIARAGAE